MEDIYKKEIRKLIPENRKELDKLIEINDKDILKKITNSCNKYGYDKDELLIKIKECIYVKDRFIKEPIKQNITEKIASKEIEKIKFITEFENLSNDKLFISNGTLRTKKEIKDIKINLKCKSIDFKFCINYENIKRDIYCYHKYINESGGSQDNQYKDIKSFIFSANENINTTINWFLVICDGGYFTEIKVKELKEMCNPNKNVYYTNIGIIGNLLRNLFNIK